MIRYAYDLHPRTEPRDGARLVRFSQYQAASYMAQRNGTGSGEIAMRGTSTDAAFISPLGLDYVRVRRINTAVVDGATLSGFSEKVIGGMFLEQGDFLAADRQRTRLLKLGGSGTLSYLDRAAMAPHTYLEQHPDVFSADDPFDGMWRLYTQGPAAGGDFLGAVLWRVIWEAQHFEDPAVNGDDRTASAIPDLVLTFDGFTDTDDNPWTVPSGEFTAQVGESVLSVTKRLMEAGLYVEMDPDTFELRAWEIANHGRDRTGLAWGADVLRFNPSPDTDRTTGNVLTDLKRAVRAIIRRSTVWAGGQDVYGVAHDTNADVLWEGFYPSDVNDTDALDAVAERQLDAMNGAGDTIRLRMKVGNDPANGYYLPGEHVLADDTATLDSGSGTWDWDEAAYPVAAWSIQSRRGGDTDAFVDLGSMYFSTADRQFTAPGASRHTHPPNPRLCAPATDGCQDVSATLAPNFDNEEGDNDHWEQGGADPNPTDDTIEPGVHSGTYYRTHHSLANPAFGYAFSGTWAAGSEYTVGFWTWVTAAPATITVGKASVGGYPPTFGSDKVTLTITDPESEWTYHELTWTPSSTYVSDGLTTSASVFWWCEHAASSLDFALQDDGTVQICALTNPLHGTSNEAARCGHAHHYLSASAPTVDDDADAGFPTTTLWTQVNDVADPTSIIGTWVSLDSSDGAAVWVALNSDATTQRTFAYFMG